METKRYNGWRNYETWIVALWIDNEQGSQSYVAEQAQEAWDDSEADRVFTRQENACRTLAEVLKSEHEEAWDAMTEDRPVSVFSDLMGAVLSEVDWDEVADHYFDDIDMGEEVDA